MGILNIFNKHKTGEVEKKTVSQEQEVSQVEAMAPEELNMNKAESQELNFSERLDDLKGAIQEMETHDMEITEEVFENIMQMKIGDFMEYVNGGENIKETDVKNLHKNISQILDGQLNKEYKSGGRLKELLRKPASKIAFATLILFLKFAPHAQAHEAPVKDNFDTNHKIEKFDGGNGPKAPGDAEKTYVYNAENSSEMALENMAKIDLTNSYETDKALISEADAKAIQDNFKVFLDQINSNNFHKVMGLDFKIYGSSDERQTNAWKGGNLELTQARITAAEEIIKAEFKNHDFSKAKLTPEQIKGLQEKGFKYGIPENGVTHIIDLTNPDTGKNYTDKDVNEMKKNDIAKYNELLKECRYIKVNLMASADEIKPIPNLEPKLELKTQTEVPKLTVKLINQYDQTIILMDNSPSMEDSKNFMGSELQAVDKAANIKVATFSDHLDGIASTGSFYEAGKTMKNMRAGGNAHERATLAADSALSSFNTQGEKIMESKLLLINTDESIQTTKGEIDKLFSDSQKKGVKVYFNMGLDNNKQVLKVPLEEMKSNFDNLYEKKVAKIQADINKAKEQLASRTVKGSMRGVIKDRLEYLEKQLENLPNQEFKIKSFELPDGRIVNMAA